MHHQIHTRNNWLGPIFFSPGDSDIKGSLVFLYLDLKGIIEVDTNQKGKFLYFKVIPLPLMTEFSAFMPLQAMAPGNSRQGGVSLKGYKIIWKIKMRKMKAK